MSFCTAITCMDGRFTDAITHSLRSTLGVQYVNLLTAAGPVAGFAGEGPDDYLPPMLRGARLSIEGLGVSTLAIAAHHGCLGNPQPEEVQRRQLHAAVERLASDFPELEVLGLWIDAEKEVEVVVRAAAGSQQ